MGMREMRVSAFIAKSEDFARPILEHLRETVHAACPECKETIKWGFPFFTVAGKPICFMNAFRHHAAFGFWKGQQVMGDVAANREAMGHFGRVERLEDLPSRTTLLRLVRRAAALKTTDVPPGRPAARAKPRPALRMPAAFATALRSTPGAWANWQAFPPSHRREYIEWILDAKLEATRNRRMATAVAQVAEGKSQNWKYSAKKR